MKRNISSTPSEKLREKTFRIIKKNIPKLIQSKLQATIQILDKISADICELMKNVELTQDQLHNEIGNV